MDVSIMVHIDKVKKVVKKNSEIVSFFKSLFTFIDDHSSAIRHRAMEEINRMSIRRPRDGDPMAKFAEVLTPYAYSLVSKQYEASANVTKQADGSYLSHEGILAVTIVSCMCAFFNTTRLPCRHVFHERSLTHLSAFDDNLAPQRWQRAFWHSSVSSYTTGVMSVSHHQSSQHNERILSETEKFRQAKVVTDELRQVVSASGMPDFNTRINQLQILLQNWKDGRCVHVTGCVPF